MATITVDLPPELYRRIEAEAARQGVPVAEVVGQWLSDHVGEAVAPDVALAPEVQALLERMPVTELLGVPGASASEVGQRLREWNDEDAAVSEDDQAAWEAILRSLDANRTSDRPLFAWWDSAR